MDCLMGGEGGRLPPSDRAMWQRACMQGDLWGFGTGTLGAERGPFDLEKSTEGLWGQVLGELSQAGVHKT